MMTKQHELEKWIEREMRRYLADAGNDASCIGFIEYLHYYTRETESYHARTVEQFNAELEKVGDAPAGLDKEDDDPLAWLR